MPTEPDTPFDLAPEQLIELFESGEVEVEGRMPYSSNATLLVTVRGHDEVGDPIEQKAIYKPGQGERPLWDFPEGLYKREAAMYRLARALDLDVIPPTTIAVGPFGEGSFQAFVDADFAQHYFTLHEAGIGLDDMRSIAVLDIIGNNADRKSGHCLIGPDNRIYGIDNGLSFHAQFKLRTVMWDFVGEPVPESLMDSIDTFLETGPPIELACLLDAFEVGAMMTRARALLDAGVYPADDTDGHRWPWPLV
ncbi:MAG: phosphatidylinositol kinase [Acidimicrobiales bacterium]